MNIFYDSTTLPITALALAAGAFAYYNSASLQLSIGCALSIAAATKFIWSRCKTQNAAFTVELPPLTVEISPQSSYPSMAATAETWTFKAKKKKDSSPSLEEHALFSNCEFVSKSIKETLQRPFPDKHHFYVCRNNQQTQGMMLIKDQVDTVEIIYLVTHPNNIRPTLNMTETTRVKGVGSALLRAAEKRATLLGKQSVSLKTLISAQPFYLKNGYEDQGNFNMVKNVSQTVQPIFKEHAA